MTHGVALPGVTQVVSLAVEDAGGLEGGCVFPMPLSSVTHACQKVRGAHSMAWGGRHRSVLQEYS